MFGHLGFSYTGALFLLMLMVPNFLWTGKKPQGYTAEGENRVLQMLERAGEVLTSCCALVFSDFNLRPWTVRSWWLAVAAVLMVLYELWWIRYFRSARTLADFYSSFAGIPLAGATLPVAAFGMLGLYGNVIWMLPATVILGVGHIGIHLQHRRELSQ